MVSQTNQRNQRHNAASRAGPFISLLNYLACSGAICRNLGPFFYFVFQNPEKWCRIDILFIYTRIHSWSFPPAAEVT